MKPEQPPDPWSELIDQCHGSSVAKTAEAERDKGDDRAAAWHSVWDALTRHNPEFSREYTRGLDAALGEIKRLYAVEARAALLLLRQGEFGDALRPDGERNG